MTIRRRLPLLAALLLVLAVALPSCGFVGALQTTQSALEDAGYRVEDLDATYRNDGTVVTVRWWPRAETHEELDAESDGAARIVWEVAPFRLLGVVIQRADTRTITGYDRGELEKVFGPRPPGLDDEELGDTFARGLFRGLAVAAVVFVAVVVLVVVLAVRWARRRRTPAPAWGGYGGYPPPVPPGYGPPPPAPPPGYRPPSPPGDDPYAAPPF